MIEVSRTKKMHRKRKLKNVELIINPKWPWLGASLDALVDSDTIQIVEVKWASTKWYQTIISACDDKRFCLELCNGVPKLKRQHPYFYQCQGITAITEIDKLDFVVYILKDMHIEAILFEQGKWNKKILPKLTNFFFDYMKENIVKDLTWQQIFKVI